jgi:hypothetical protein
MEKEDECLGFGGLFEVSKVQFRLLVSESPMLGVLLFIEYRLLALDLLNLKHFFTV